MRKEKGVLTVEASISLTLFMFIVLFLFSFARVYRAQNMVGHATLQAADAIALESYLRETAFQSDPEEIQHLASLIAESDTLTLDNFESLRSADLHKIAKEKFAAAIAVSQSEADNTLKNLGVKNGVAGVDFSNSRMDYDNDDVIVSVAYTIEMQFPLFGGQQIDVTKSAKAKTFGDILFSVTTQPNKPDWGKTGGDTKVTHGKNVEIWAEPNYGYEFVKWNDGNTDNPRIVNVTDTMSFIAIFQPRENGVNLSINNGTWGLHETKMGKVTGAGNYKYLDTVTIKAQAKEHYYFVGWDYNNDGKPDNTNASMTIHIDQVDTAYYYSALFKPVQYKIEVRVNNGNMGNAIVSQNGRSGISIMADYDSNVQLIASSKNGMVYRFVNWNDGNTDNGRTVKVTGNATYTANFEYNTYSVNFFVGSNKVHTTSVIRGSSISGSRSYLGSNMPSNPSSSGKNFDHWEYNGINFDSSTSVNGNINVYAKWNCKVTFDGNGGTKPSSITVYEGAWVNFDGYNSYRDGYRFLGWYSGSERFSGGRNIYSNITVTAQWECKHRYDNGVSRIHPISSTKKADVCSDYKIISRCEACGYEEYDYGIGNHEYDAWCGVIHDMSNPGNYQCEAINYRTHRWEKYGCMTCRYCGKFKNGMVDRYGNYRSGSGNLWCIKHNGHKRSGIIKCNRNDNRHSLIP